MNKTPRLLELIDAAPGLCKAAATYQKELKSILFQIQLDSTTEDNMTTVGPVILALKKVHDVFDDVILKGEADIQKENQKKKE